MMFHVSSIARYSNLYWYNKFSDQWAEMTPQEQQATTRKRKWWQWVIVGICDIGGGIAGATVNAGIAITAGAAASTAAATIINWGAEDE